MQTQPNDGDIWLVYDGECPLCRTYCKYVRVREAAGRLHLIDARQPGPLMDEITAAGLDIDQGMVVKMGGRLYYGPDAIHVLTLLSTPSGLFNRASYLFFGSERAASIWYPISKAVRNMVLKVMGIRYIENLKRAPGTNG